MFLKSKTEKEGIAIVEFLLLLISKSVTIVVPYLLIVFLITHFYAHVDYYRFPTKVPSKFDTWLFICGSRVMRRNMDVALSRAQIFWYRLNLCPFVLINIKME